MTSTTLMPNPALLGKIRAFPFIPLAIGVFMLARLFAFGGLNWFGVTVLSLAVLWFGVEATRWLFNLRYETVEKDPSRQIIREEPETLVSLVFFLEEAREVTEENLQQCVSHALGIKLDDSDADSEFFVVQYSPPTSGITPIENFMIRIPQGVFSVMLSNRPYISNPEKFARDSIRDKRLRTAVEKHRAWISVDLMDDDIESAREAYSVIGKLLGAMAGPDCLALYCPEIQRCNEFEPSQIEILMGGDPLSIFDEPTFEPVIEVSDNDPRMAAAEKTARDRWPEFVEAFAVKDLEDAEKFIVKAEFTEGTRSEFMWVTVTAIQENRVKGILTNDPHELVNVFRGAEVDFSLKRLNDWIYPGKDGTPVGGFTLDILSEDLD
ncbi:MAG: DUF2314 domain-containing protein [Verrucomicrobiales bacterium]|nr:DUF2314 domain-containing protein [Verrucomicrobiales bacterium]